MTLGQAIIYYKELSKVQYEMVDAYHTDEGVYSAEESMYRDWAEKNNQLAEWLKDYKRLLEQEPKEGHWINGTPICPCCGEDKFKDLDADIWADWQPKYCPNCGARMVETQKSDTEQGLSYADQDTLMSAT